MSLRRLLPLASVLVAFLVVVLAQSQLQLRFENSIFEVVVPVFDHINWANVTEYVAIGKLISSSGGVSEIVRIGSTFRHSVRVSELVRPGWRLAFSVSACECLNCTCPSNFTTIELSQPPQPAGRIAPVTELDIPAIARMIGRFVLFAGLVLLLARSAERFFNWNGDLYELMYIILRIAIASAIALMLVGFTSLFP